jgi:monothiol glutaredoxin
MSTESPTEIKAYLKPSCGWSRGVRAVFAKYQLPFEDINIISSADSYREMVRKSGQPLSPCVEIDGVMLADVSGEEVEKYLISKGIVKPVQAVDDTPLDRGCHGEEPVEMGEWSAQKKS